jgi:hypothetical protein
VTASGAARERHKTPKTPLALYQTILQAVQRVPVTRGMYYKSHLGAPFFPPGISGGKMPTCRCTQVCGFVSVYFLFFCFRVKRLRATATATPLAEQRDGQLEPASLPASELAS